MTKIKEEGTFKQVEVEEPTQPKAEEITELPSYSYSLQYTHFRKNHLFAKAFFGAKTIKREGLHSEEIGENISTCRNLFGLGYTAQRLVINGNRLDLGLSEYSNHVWLPQINEACTYEEQLEGRDKLMQVCLNCGSLFMDGKFYAANIVEKLEKEKEKQKKN